LVTGGAGFIGSHLAEHLASRGDQVTVLDLRPMPVVTSGVAYVCGNVTHRETLTGLIRHHDAVFHLAAVVGFANVMREPIRTMTTCLHGTSQVLELCATYGKRLLFTSTSAIYGRTVDDQRPVEETDPSRLGSPAVRSWCYAYA